MSAAPMTRSTRHYTLGYSTCPNDTYIFEALVHGRVPCGDIGFEVVLKDVEALNQDARRGVLDFSKLSFAALGHLLPRYGLLRCGAALGRGCGPLIIARPGTDPNQLGRRPVAVPGLWTTACLLLGLYLGDRPLLAPMPFDRIMPAVASGEVPFGVIIHEGRFTYSDHGLEMIADLGRWWEAESGLPIPLGGIAARRDLPAGVVRTVDQALGRSVAHARRNPDDSRPYIRRHAQEMDPTVIDRHIELYVNAFSIDLGPEGEAAVAAFFQRARQAGLLPAHDGSIWAYPQPDLAVS